MESIAWQPLGGCRATCFLPPWTGACQRPRPGPEERGAGRWLGLARSRSLSRNSLHGRTFLRFRSHGPPPPPPAARCPRLSALPALLPRRARFHALPLLALLPSRRMCWRGIFPGSFCSFSRLLPTCLRLPALSLRRPGPALRPPLPRRPPPPKSRKSRRRRREDSQVRRGRLVLLAPAKDGVAASLAHRSSSSRQPRQKGSRTAGAGGRGGRAGDVPEPLARLPPLLLGAGALLLRALGRV